MSTDPTEDPSGEESRSGRTRAATATPPRLDPKRLWPALYGATFSEALRRMSFDDAPTCTSTAPDWTAKRAPAVSQ